MGLPGHAAALRLRGDLDDLAGLRTACDDAPRLIDQPIRGRDRDLQRAHYLPTLVTIIAAVRSLVIGVTFRPFLVAQMFL